MALFKKDKETKKEDVQVAEAPKETKSVATTVKDNLDWVLIKPRITEKTAIQMESNQYTFNVHKDANRSQVKQAVKAAYKVNPTKVNISIRDNRMKRRRGRLVADRGYKKAIVTLPKGESIEIV